jgi:TonB family protein
VRVGIATSLVVAALIGVTACPGGGEGDTTPDPLPANFTPGPPLDDPLPGDPEALGAAYLAKIGPRLQDRWSSFLENCRTRLPPSHAFNDTSMLATVEMIVAGDGAVKRAAIAMSSGNAEYDDVALEIVRDAGVLPAPPASVLSDDGAAHLTWTFARDRRQAGAGTAKLERVEWPLDRSVPALLEAGRLAEAARRIERSGEGPEAVVLADRVAEAAIVAALAGDDVAGQRVAIKASSAVKLSAAAPMLRKLAANAVDLELRRAAIAALGAIGDADSVDTLVDIVRTTSDDEQRSVAAGALRALGAGARAWEVIEPGLGGDEAEQWASLVALAQAPATDAVPRLAEILAGRGKRGVRAAAALALGASVQSVGAKASKPLIAGLADRDATVRAACAQALATAAADGYRSKAAFWETVKLLEDKDDRARAGATLAAALLGGASFVKEMHRLRKESTIAVLAALAEGLAAVPGDDAFQRLVGLAGHEDPELRRAVARALRQRREPEASTLLASWTGDPDMTVRLFAIASVDDAAALRDLLGDDEAEVRAAALWRLASISGREAALADAAHALSEASTLADRAVIAGGWLSAAR